jgi:hypothetical protein
MSNKLLAGKMEWELVHTATGGRLHIRLCPHVFGVENLVPATSADRETTPVCSWCQAELDGVGRTRHESIETALADSGAPQHARPELARLLRIVEHDTVYVPNSRSYVAVARDGVIVASAGKTYVWYPDRPVVQLDDYASATGASATPGPEDWGEICESCFTTRSKNGSCGCY